jgi:hypothetical protein
MGHTLKLDGVCRVILAAVIALNTALSTECKLSGGSSLCLEFGYCFPEAAHFGAAGGFGEVYHIFLVDTLTGPCREEYLKEAGREMDEGPRAGGKATESGNTQHFDEEGPRDREDHSEEGLARRLGAVRGVPRRDHIWGHGTHAEDGWRLSRILVTVIAENTAMKMKSK